MFKIMNRWGQPGAGAPCGAGGWMSPCDRGFGDVCAGAGDGHWFQSLAAAGSQCRGFTL